ncbi:hypothetical protein [Nodosilinea sp. AN01ver1]|uniref:hypothetical protein n=1 Tax=Nodosilinea sp. AN01ver1 TaxID=3423362 RepID=UPI003D31CF3A
MVAYPRLCRSCSQPILISEMSPGNWQPWNFDGGRHHCGSHQTNGNTNLQIDLSKAETYLTRCQWCRDHVYYHTNGNGDCVYFDSLGYPWQVHGCWQRYWQDAKQRRQALALFRSRSKQDQQKLVILLGILHSLCKTESRSLLFDISEARVARAMGITKADLKRDYGHLYSLTVYGCINITANLTQPNSTEDRAEKAVSRTIDCQFCEKHVLNCSFISHLERYHHQEVARLAKQFAQDSGVSQKPSKLGGKRVFPSCGKVVAAKNLSTHMKRFSCMASRLSS